MRKCEYPDRKCPSMETQDNTCLLRNPFNCPMSEQGATAEALRKKAYHSKQDELLLAEIAKSLYFIRTSTTKNPEGSSWDRCKNKRLWLSNADMILNKAKPIIEKQEREK